MIATALLLIYAVLAGSAAAYRLRRARWPLRSPRLGILAWQALSASVVLATFLAGATVAVPIVPISAKLADVVDACWLAIREQYSTPGGAAVASLGVLLMLAVAGRLGFVLAVEWVATSRRRRHQRRSLLLVARRHAVTGALVLPHPTSAVYCLPGRRGVIVCTSAAIATLSVHQLNAVLAHERAHLHARHHLVLTAAASLRTAFPVRSRFWSRPRAADTTRRDAGRRHSHRQL
jgi:Zn-dependent protease with chaperone function